MNKYRYWDKLNKAFKDPECYAVGQYEGRSVVYWLGMNEYYVDDDVIALPFTGWKDIDGVEIYEGDLIRLDNNDEREVEYLPDMGRFVIGHLLSSQYTLDIYHAKVVGNIFDSKPEKGYTESE